MRLVPQRLVEGLCLASFRDLGLSIPLAPTHVFGEGGTLYLWTVLYSPSGCYPSCSQIRYSLAHGSGFLPYMKTSTLSRCAGAAPAFHQLLTCNYRLSRLPPEGLMDYHFSLLVAHSTAQLRMSESIASLNAVAPSALPTSASNGLRGRGLAPPTKLEKRRWLVS